VAVELATKNRIEAELGDLDDLKSLFSMRNKLMHFRPTVQKISFGKKSSDWQGRNCVAIAAGTEPWKFPRAVTDAILAFHRITQEEPVDRVDEIVTRAIEKETTDYLMEWSKRVGAVLTRWTLRMSKPREYYEELPEETTPLEE
jgi:hypothetical protein